MRDPNALTKRQAQILAFMIESTKRDGYPPSVREIGSAVMLSSSSTVHSHLQALESKGYIRREGSGARAIIFLKDPDGRPLADINSVETSYQVVSLPVVGQVAAGTPILAEQNIEEMLPMPRQLVGNSDSFMLTVRGESMIEAGIMDGDYVVVRQQQTADNGDIVVAMLEDEATVKTFYREPDRIRLQPQNSSMEPIYTNNVTILGKVIALLRTL